MSTFQDGTWTLILRAFVIGKYQRKQWITSIDKDLNSASDFLVSLNPVGAHDF